MGSETSDPAAVAGGGGGRFPVIPELRAETARRRTFAIISHPDAGKTTLTEKLLLYSGMIETAGMVRGRKAGKKATSDWMAMEQERGISITASAMQFTYKDAVLNVLDTPGHQDFSEDTYRTLTAADSAIMVIDAAKGIEAQTRKLFEVCRLRKIPVLTFVNKMDLEARDPLDLMAEVEKVLGIHASALNWPVGAGRGFTGVVDRVSRELLVFSKVSAAGAAKARVERVPLDHATGGGLVAPDLFERARRDLELLEIAGNPFSREAFLCGEVTPVFFGSALTNFGVEPFFDAFVNLAPAPRPRTADGPDGREVEVDPIATPFSAYVFKLQANMDPRHRDSLAFLRVCSGRFDRDLLVRHHRLGREVRLTRPHTLVARERNRLEVAYPGDIVGVINSGLFAIGDTISLSGGFDFKPLPQFPPEVFAEVRPTDVGKRKSFDKGVEQLTREGTIQILRRADDPMARPIVAAVGRLQLDVLEYRLRDEYGVACAIEVLPFKCSIRVKKDVETFKKPFSALLTRDAAGRAVVLFASEWERAYARRENPDHELTEFG
jgi:peptide chain release factor 3